ncbi:MAG TPA: hypothetical protein DCE33_13595 [Rhodospirillaceae bacterium]|nr:hypothetical protein [Rhodospirillaceae bacterium]
MKENDAFHAKNILRAIGAGPDSGFDLAEGALAFAALDRPRVPLDHYTGHLGDLAVAAGANRSATPLSAEAAAGQLREVVVKEFGYAGDRLTYDDLQNANLMRVIDRRRGLPVALGILYIHIGRALCWTLNGLAFPGHFLIQLDFAGDRVILDPFNDGRTLGAGDLRQLIKTLAGTERELETSDYAAVSDREILLRLQNNIKFRHMQMRNGKAALITVENMLLIAPASPALWWEAGMLNAEIGNLHAATDALEEFMRLEESSENRHRAATLMQKLRSQLN